MPPSAFSSFAQWFEVYAPPLVLYARQWLDGSAAEDAVQEAFIQLLKQRHAPPNVRAWLYRGVRQKALSAARSGRRRRRREQNVGQMRGQWFEPAMDNRLDAEFAQAALERLPAAQREIVILRIWSQLTLGEISEVTGAPVSSVHDRYNAALRALRTMLEKPCPTIS
jgi:RNA polymerase sigma-70 factor (ECF subfamily)